MTRADLLGFVLLIPLIGAGCEALDIVPNDDGTVTVVDPDTGAEVFIPAPNPSTEGGSLGSAVGNAVGVFTGNQALGALAAGILATIFSRVVKRDTTA